MTDVVTKFSTPRLSTGHLSGRATTPTARNASSTRDRSFPVAIAARPVH